MCQKHFGGLLRRMIPLDESCNFHTSKMDRVKGPRARTLEGLVVPLPWRLRTSSAEKAAGTTARISDATIESNLIVVFLE